MRRAAIVIATSLCLAGCGLFVARETPPVVVSESCAVIARLLYQDGRFQFSDAEIAALSSINQVKLDSVKRYFRTCPEYQELLKAKASTPAFVK
jgi:hypothetical protein